MKTLKVALVLIVLSTGFPALDAQVVDSKTVSPVTAAETPVELSPFEVNASKDRGYLGASALSGTRLNSSLEDLASSITVITKEQMLDFAALDINDLFKYEAGTEGTATFTNFAIGANGEVSDQVQLNPQTSNRIRGLGSANISMDGFPQNSAIPIDPYNTERVELSRGANTSLFGLGAASGTVNVLRTGANLTRDISSLTLRGDSYGGYRSSIDLSRPVVRDKLALRLSAVYDSRGYLQRPSADVMRRQQATVMFRPFKTTTIRATYERLGGYARRPNSVTPRDAVTYWKQVGSPAWDPITEMVTYSDGRKTGPWPVATDATMDAFMPISNATNAITQMFIDNGTMKLWTVPRLTATANPNSFNASTRLKSSGTAIQRLRGTTMPLFVTPGITDQSLYDWESQNFVATNWRKDKGAIKNIQVEQELLRTPTQQLVARIAYNEERFESQRREDLSALYAVLMVDVNERLLDGSPNPYFRRPYIGTAGPQTMLSQYPVEQQSADLAYQWTPNKQPRWFSWVGRQRLLLHGEYQGGYTNGFRYRDTVVDDHSWSNSANRADGNLMNRVYFKYYLGDNQGQNADYAPPTFYGVSGTYNLSWYNGATKQWSNEASNLQPAAIVQGSTRARNEVRTLSLTSQNYFLKDRVVTTFAVRRDRQRGRSTAASTADINPATGFLEYAGLKRFTPWSEAAGDTKTAGVVVKPTRWVNAFFNYADSFQPGPVQYTPFGDLLPNPNGKGKDFGLLFNLCDGKLVLKANGYQTKQLSARNATAAAIAARALAYDTTRGAQASGSVLDLETWSTRVITERFARQGVTGPASQIKSEVAKFMQLPEGFLDYLAPKTLSATDDVTSKGMEFEANYNPTRSWTLKGNITFQRAINSALSQEVQRYIDWRMPVWTTIKDDQGVAWWDTAVSNAPNNFSSGVVAPYKLLIANQGKPRSQAREWRGNLLTTYRFSSGRFKNLSVGGAVRWESRAPIGFYGAAPDRDGIVRAYDGNRPIYDRARSYIDLTTGYNLRLFSDRVRARIQLNVQNALENGRLQVVGVNPDGQPYNFRIVYPRQFVLTTTFDL